MKSKMKCGGKAKRAKAKPSSKMKCGGKTKAKKRK